MCSDSSCLLPVGGGFSGGEFFPSGFSHALNFWHVLCSLAGEATTSCLQWVTSSLMPEWDLKGAVPEQGGSAQQVCLALLHGGLVHSFVLCQTWSKCSDDKIVPAPFFFFLPPVSFLCSGQVIYSHHRLRAGGCQGSTDAAIMCGT